jgi:hypothetical protein
VKGILVGVLAGAITALLKVDLLWVVLITLGASLVGWGIEVIVYVTSHRYEIDQRLRKVTRL